MCGNESPYDLSYTAWHLTVPTIYMYKRSVLEVDDSEVCQHLMYEQKESIGSNVLHMEGVPLSLEILGGIPQPCNYEDHRDSIRNMNFLWIGL